MYSVIVGRCLTLISSFPVSPRMPLYTGFVQLGAGLSVGLSGLAAGFAIGIVGDAGVRGTAQQPKLFVGMVCLIAITLVRSANRRISDPHPHFCRSLGLVRYVERICAWTVLYICCSGLIVALIMNTAAAGAVVRVCLLPKYQLSDFVSSAHKFPEHTSRGVWAATL
jgi:F0F1-type ATP synthase membrane subunit c/vacuolar-type H+-ATPase subunit K